MTVSVLMPQQQQQRQENKETALDKIIKGVQVATGIYGIYSDMSKLDAAKQAQELAMKRQGEANAIAQQRLELDNKRADRGLDIQEKGLAQKEDQFQRELDYKTTHDNKELASKNATNKKTDIKNEFDLRRDYKKDSKTTEDVIDAYGRVKAATAGQANGANDMAMIFGYMKLLDPNSTVREGEYASAASTRNIPDNIVALYNKSLGSEAPILTPQQRSNFMMQADQQFKQRLGEQMKIDQEYASYAEGMGVPREKILSTRYQAHFNDLNKQRNTIQGPLAPGAYDAFDPDKYLNGR